MGRQAVRLPSVAALLLLLAACGGSGQPGSRVSACEQATALDRQMASDREAARTSLESSGYATTGGQADPGEAARRSQEVNAKLAAEQRRLGELRSRCLGSAP
jgi:hypothetical protein